MRSKRITGAVIAAIGALAIGVPAAVASTSTTPHHAVCKVDGIITPDTRHHIPAGISLYRWASHHADGVANVLGATAECGPGWQQEAMLTYLDSGKDALGQPAPAGGLIVWTPYYQK